METIVGLFELTLLSSLEAALMAGLIFVVLAAFRRKLAPFWRYALWLLLIVKLLLPWIPGNLGDDFHWIRLPVRLRLSNQVAAPTLFGLISPIVLIPRNMADQLNAVEWECVFRHELVHYKRRDIWVNTIFTLLAAVHWFNPAIWYGLHRMRFEQEAACDASVMAALGAKDTYADSLIKVLEIGASQRSAPAGIGFSNYKNVITRRMRMIRNFQPSNKRSAILGVIVLCIVALFALPSTFAKEGTVESPFAKNPASAEKVQAEGEQKESVSTSTEVLGEISFVMPASGKITSVFGYRTHPVSKKQLLHDGIDIANREGTDVFASSSGKVIKAEYDGAYGFTVVIEHNESWQSEYRHLKELSVNQGDMVNTNDRIGQMGRTGQATGSHLHFSIRKDGEYLDPEPFLHE